LDRLKAHQRQVTGPHEDPECAADHVDHGPVPRELVEMEVKMPHFADIFHRHLQRQNVILERTVPTCPKPANGNFGVKAATSKAAWQVPGSPPSF
jgi:hypothetical protein